MELFNKLASNNTTEGGDIENKIMHRILTAREDLELDVNKEGHYSYCNMEQFLQDAGYFETQLVNVVYILTICKMEGFERSTNDLKSLKGRKICQHNLGTLNNNGKTDILVAKE